MLGNLFEDDGDVGFSVAESSRNKYPGIDLPPPPRSACGLCGISNQGATCYLNSLIQTLVYTPEFRGRPIYIKAVQNIITVKHRATFKIRAIEQLLCNYPKVMITLIALLGSNILYSVTVRNSFDWDSSFQPGTLVDLLEITVFRLISINQQ